MKIRYAALLAKGVLKTGSVRRLPLSTGTGFQDKRDGYDFTLADDSAICSYGGRRTTWLGKKEELHVATLDLNAAVNSHVAKAFGCREGRTPIRRAIASGC